MKSSLSTLLGTGIALLAGWSPLFAQSLIGMSSNGTMTGFVGPSSGMCNYPPGPLTSQWTWTANYLCPTPKTVGAPPALLGDMSVEPLADQLWTTDGLAVAEHQAFGTIVRSFALIQGDFLPGKLTGLGRDGQLDLLWITDGTQAAAIQPPSAPGCPQTPLSVVPAFPLPLAGGALATDIEFDPSSGTLWICDTQGFVSEVNLDGSLGAAGRFNAVAQANCGLGPVLQSLALDRSGPVGTLFVTDGARVFHCVAPTGAPAAASFAFGDDCWTPPAGNLVGLVLNAYGTIYGSASSGFLPVLGAVGQAVQGNLDFRLQLAGAKKNELAGLFAGPFPFCPAVPIAGGMALTLIDAATLLKISVVDLNGLVNLPVPLTNSIPTGLSVYLQWYTVDPVTFATKTTPGLELTVCRP